MALLTQYFRIHSRIAAITEIIMGAAMIPIVWLLVWALHMNIAPIQFVQPLLFVGAVVIAIEFRRWKFLTGLFGIYLLNLILRSLITLYVCKGIAPTDLFTYCLLNGLFPFDATIGSVCFD
jgi:hypothetical protein